MAVKTNLNSLLDNLGEIRSELIDGADTYNAMKEIGSLLKRNTMNNEFWKSESGYDLDQSGGFTSMMEQQQPTVIYDNPNSVSVGFGNVNTLNKYTRPHQTVAVKRPARYSRRRGYRPSYTQIFSLEKGTLPVWILAEWGSGDKKDKTDDSVDKFYNPAFESNGKQGLSPWLGTPSGHKKQIRIMVNRQQVSHGGTKPTKMFRMGLFKSLPEINDIIKRHIRRAVEGVDDD